MAKLFGILLIVLLSLAGCASQGLRKDWKARGYTEADIKEVQKYEQGYIDILASGSAFSNSYNSAEKIAAEGRVRSIYCSCVKKLGSKCQMKPEALVDDDRTLWAKSNAAESALRAMASVQNPFSSGASAAVDSAECH